MRKMQLPVMAAFVCICVTASLSRAQPTLSGTVTDKQGSALENAVVDLRGAGLRVLTDSEGVFRFGDSSPAGSLQRPARFQPEIVFRRNKIGLRVAGRGTYVRAAVYSAHGSRVLSIYEGALEPDMHWFRIPETLPNGTWILRMEKGGACSTVAFTLLAGQILPKGAARESRMDARPNPGAVLSRVAASDTLTAFKYGYYPTTMVVADLDANGVGVSLERMPRDSIVPPGMKRIPGGTFMMGSEAGDPNETPVHEVAVSSFFMDSTEVSQMDYRSTLKVEPWLGYDGFYAGGVDPYRPVWYIHWFDAVLYCNERSKRDGLDTVYSYSSITGIPGDGCSLEDVQIHYDRYGYRLPTEAEWEYAARGGTSSEYYWGNSTEPAIVDLYAWYEENSDGLVHTVAKLAPNDFGLYDILGNVWEACNDYHFFYEFFLEQTVDPTGPSDGSARVLRGGAWHHPLTQLRCARRYLTMPASRSNANNAIGIRAVLPGK